MDERLHDLLRQAVPEDAPSLDPGRVVAAARRARHRSRALAGSVAVAVLVAGGAIGAATVADRDDRTADRPTRDPYGVPRCPAALPAPDQGTPSLDLADVTSVRLCPDLSTLGEESAVREVLDGMDALVAPGVDDLGDRLAVAGSPADGCGPFTPEDQRPALQLEHADGRTTLVPLPACSPVRVGSRELPAGDVVEAYLLSLRAQRAGRPAPRAHLPAPSCDQLRAVPSPAEPGQAHLVRAVACGPNGNGTVLDAEQVAELDEAWQRPEPIDEADGCATDPVYLGAVTDQGDLVFLQETSCGSLTWQGDLGAPAELATTVQRLGVRI